MAFLDTGNCCYYIKAEIKEYQNYTLLEAETAHFKTEKMFSLKKKSLPL